MFNPSRAEARRFFFDTWRKYGAKETLSALEGTALEIILQHPEYHAMLSDPDNYLDRDYLPEFGETNPFLHMSMHLAIAEQLSINQPTGICDHFKNLLEQCGTAHDAQHITMDCLAEMIWQAQRDQSSPDAALYLECMQEKVRR